MAQHTLPDTFTPKLAKGQLVEVVMGCQGVRRTTDAELKNWDAERRRLGDWFDSAGESRLPPLWSTDDFSPGRKFTVLRAAASVNHIWNRQRHMKCALLLCTGTGHEYYVNKRYLRAV